MGRGSRLCSASATDPMRIAAIHTRLSDIDAYSAEARGASILSGLGFTAEDQLKPSGNYDTFERQLAERNRLDMALMAKQEDERRKLEAFVTRFKAKASTALYLRRLSALMMSRSVMVTSSFCVKSTSASTRMTASVFWERTVRESQPLPKPLWMSCNLFS